MGSEDAMIDESPQEDSQTAPQRSRRRIQLLALAAGLSLAALWAFYGTAPALPQGKLVAVRDESEKFQVNGEVSSSSFTAQVMTKQSETQTDGTSSASLVDNVKFHCRTVAIRNESNSLLAQRVGYELFQQLQQASWLHEVQYLPQGVELSSGELLPDIFLSIRQTSFSESGTAPFRQLDADFEFAFCDTFVRSNCFSSRRMVPPVLQYAGLVHINVDENQVGVETASARYQGTASEIAKTMFRELQNFVEKNLEEYGAPDGLPESLFPEYAPPIALPMLAGLDATKIFDGRRFMYSNQTLWRIHDLRDPTAFVESMRQHLKADGWTEVETFDWNGSPTLYISKNEKETVVEVFREQRSPPMWDSSDDVPPEDGDYYILYSQLISDAKIRDALQQLVQSSPSDEVLTLLAPFSKFADDETRDYLKAYWRQNTRDPNSLARQKWEAGQFDEAKRLLQRDHVLRLITGMGNTAAIESLAEEMGLEALLETPDLTALQPGDYLDVRNVEAPELTIQSGETVNYLLDGNQEVQIYLSLTHQPGTPATICEKNTQFREGGGMLGAKQIHPLSIDSPIRLNARNRAGFRFRLLVQQDAANGTFTMRLLRSERPDFPFQ